MLTAGQTTRNSQLPSAVRILDCVTYLDLKFYINFRQFRSHLEQRIGTEKLYDGGVRGHRERRA